MALDSIVSDIFGKSASAITDHLTSDGNFDAKHCVPLLQHSLKNKAKEIPESIAGYEITAEQKTRIGTVRDHFHYIDILIERVDTCIIPWSINTKATSSFFLRYQVLPPQQRVHHPV